MRNIILILAALSLVAMGTGCKESSETGEGQSSVEEQAKTDQPVTEEAGEVVTTASGLKYIDLVEGQGEEAVSGMTVSVHYTGWLAENGAKGRKFDSSRDRGEPYQVNLGAGRVIRGWEEGLQGMKVGGQRRLIIPPELGYGARGAGRLIPPNATLIFDVEFVDVAQGEG